MSTPISTTAAQLIADYAHEVSDAREWPNVENEKRTRQALLEYISALELTVKRYNALDLQNIQSTSKPAKRAFTGGGL